MTGRYGDLVHRSKCDKRAALRSKTILLSANGAAHQGHTQYEESQTVRFHFALVSRDSVWGPCPKDLLIASTITDSLTKPTVSSTILPERSTKNVSGRRSAPPYESAIWSVPLSTG